MVSLLVLKSLEAIHPSDFLGSLGSASVLLSSTLLVASLRTRNELLRPKLRHLAQHFGFTRLSVPLLCCPHSVFPPALPRLPHLRRRHSLSCPARTPHLISVQCLSARVYDKLPAL